MLWRGLALSKDKLLETFTQEMICGQKILQYCKFGRYYIKTNRPSYRDVETNLRNRRYSSTNSEGEINIAF